MYLPRILGPRTVREIGYRCVWTNVSRIFLFWVAFILTRPLGATVGDFLDKPVREGGLALSRPIASAVIAIFILACLVAFPQRAGMHPDRPESTR